MRYQSPTIRNVSGQRGSAMVLAATACVVGLIAIWSLGWVPWVERQARQEVELVAMYACPAALQQAPLSRQMWESFVASLNGAFGYGDPENSPFRAQLKYAQITNVNFFVSGPEEDKPGEEFLRAPAPGVDWREISPWKSWSHFLPESESIFGVQTINDPISGEGVTVRYYNSFVRAPVSPFIVNDVKNFGNTVICSFEAVPRTSQVYGPLHLLRDGFGEDPQRITVGYWTPMLGVNSSPPLPPLAEGEVQMSPQNSPGLLLAIAPHLPTLDQAPANAAPNPVDSDGVEGIFATNSRFRPYEELGDSIESLNEAFEDESREIQESNDKGVFTLPSISLPDPHANETRELLVGCLNPLTIMRNAFLTTLNEFFIRDGQFRRGVEILSLNSILKPKVGSPPSAPPSLIASMGDDLARSNFRVPYTFTYRTTSGWDSPLESNPSPRWLDEIVLSSSQLLNCEHIYKKSPGRAFNVPFLSSLSEAEPGALYSPPELKNELNDSPWAQASEDGLSARAPEVLARLGSVRRCPYRSSSLEDPACQNVTTNINDRLVPDFNGLRLYASPASTEASEGVMKAPGVVVPSVNNFSLFNQRMKSLPPPAERNYPMLVLAIHEITPELISTIEEWRSSQKGFGLNQLIGHTDQPIWKEVRPFRLILFPAKPPTEHSVRDLLNALGSSSTERYRGLNRVLIIEPCEVNSNGELLYPEYCVEGDLFQKIGTDGEGNAIYDYVPDRIRQFWLDMVYREDLKNNIYSRAKKFFNDHLVGSQRIL